VRNKTTSKKENLFAASRFVLPEHREMYLRIKEEEARFVPPEPDDEQRAEWSGRIWQAYCDKRLIRIEWYDGRQVRRATGIIRHVDMADRRIKLETAEGTRRLSFEQVLQADWPGG
jgi:hypothetical protein